MKLRFSIITGMVFLITACANTEPNPYRDAKRINPDRVKFADKALTHELSYLAQAMMESDRRQEAVEKLLTDIKADPSAYTYKPKNKNDSSYGMQAKVGTDLLLGNLGSDLGGKVGGVIAAGEVLYKGYQMFRDDSMARTSQAFLPAIFDGVELKTAEQANKALLTFTDNLIMSISSKHGWHTQCIDGCGTPQSSYLISLKETKNPGYAYYPQDVVLVLDISEVKKFPIPNVLSLATQTPLKWGTQLGDTYLIHAYSGVIYDEAGKVELRYSDKYKRNFPSATDPLVDTPFGRDLSAEIHSTPYTYFGTQDTYPDQFFYRGKKYSFNLNSIPEMIKYELQEPNLLQAKKP